MDAAEAEQPEGGDELGPGPAGWQRRLFEVIFGHGTFAGRSFDLLLLVVIVISVVAVMLESVDPLRADWGTWFYGVEWAITILFSIEFIARIVCVNRPLRYIFSFFGLVDIVSLLPSYLELFFVGAHTLATIRMLRLLRVFRILRLAHHVREGRVLLLALRATWPKITVFISVIVCTIVILGTVMYLVEGGAGSGFDSIPVSVYWAIVTMTTVGYGDIAPVTTLGKIIASIIMLLGYSIIIVPTGLFSAQVISRGGQVASLRNCPACGQAVYEPAARFCSRCGAEL